MQALEDISEIFIKIFEDLQSLKVNIFASLKKVFWRIFKDLCNFLIEMKKLNTLKDLFRFCTHLDANQTPLGLSSRGD